MRHLHITIVILMSCLLAVGQETYLDQTHEQRYHEVMQAYDEQLFGRAISIAEQYLDTYSQLNTDHIPTDQVRIQLISRISALLLERENAHLELENYALAINPDHLANDAFFELGNYFYNEKIYESAIHYFNKTNFDLLTQDEYVEATFKTGYSHFVNKNFVMAERLFLSIKDDRNDYYYPSNYYYGMVKYFERDYDAAVKSFDRVGSSSQYKPHIPYYIAQIYFAQGKRTELINYGERAIANSGTRKIKEIRLLLGQTYFLEQEYAKALPHLEYYEANTSKLTTDEFYQLAFTQYQLHKYRDAISNFKELSNLDTKQGQLVNYYLADCYEKTGDMVSARAAFKKVSQMDYEVSMQEEALFNYGKLSAQMGFDREAINTLIKVKSDSPHFEETKPIINDILVNTDDYVGAIEIIESLDELTPELRSTYQMITLKLGLQQYQEEDIDAAIDQFRKSKEIGTDRSLSAQAQYWIAKTLQLQGEYAASEQEFETYFELANGLDDLPEGSSPYMAHYAQGYNHLQENDFYAASKRFKNAIVGINLNRETIQNEVILGKVLDDALIRAGDCAFADNNYSEAEQYYVQSIDRRAPKYVYSLYQRAMIEGLTGRPYEKIITLEEILKDHPNSAYVDDALMQLGDTYLALGNTTEAGAAFTDLIVSYYGSSPYVNAALLKKGLISYNRGDLPEALKFYKRIFVNNPSSKESQAALLAIEEIYVDDLKEADAYFAYLDSIPKYRITNYEKDSLTYVIAEKQYYNSNYESAIEDLSEYLDKFPNGASRLSAHYLRGESLSILGRYGAANADYEHIIEQGYSEHYVDALRKAAIINYNHVQDFDLAFRYYDLLVNNTQSEATKYEAQLGALRSAFRTSKDDAVIQYGSQVYASSKSSPHEKNTARYYLAKVSYRKGMTDQALIAFDEVAKNSANSQAAESRYMVAKILYDRNELDNAEVSINNANTQNTAYPYYVAKGLLLLSDIYVKKADLFNARAAIEAVIENFNADKDILAEAQKKLKNIKSLEEEQSRIKTTDANTLELDTTSIPRN